MDQEMASIVAGVCLSPVILAAFSVWMGAVVVSRKGHKTLGVGLGVAGGILGLCGLCLGLLVVLGSIPGVVDPGWSPTPVFDGFPVV